MLVRRLGLLAVAFALLGGIVAIRHGERAPVVAYPRERAVHMSFLVTNPSSRAIEGATLVVDLPEAKTATQRLRAATVAGAPLVLDGGVARVSLPRIASYGRTYVDLALMLDLAEGANERVDPPQPGAFVHAEPLIERDAPEIRALAEAVSSSAREDRIARLANTVAGLLEPAPYSARPRGALDALRTRRGDCTEYAHLVVAVARAASLPARVVDGYLVEGDARITNEDLHSWAEVWDGERWQSVDASRETPFQAWRYVAMGGSTRDASSARFSIDDERLQVRLD